MTYPTTRSTRQRVPQGFGLEDHPVLDVVLSVMLIGSLFIIGVVGAVIAIVWFTLTWPWYLWRGARRVAHPR